MLDLRVECTLSRGNFSVGHPFSFFFWCPVLYPVFVSIHPFAPSSLLPSVVFQPSYTYLWSFLFKSYSTAQNSFLFHNLITGLILPLATTIMSLFTGTVSDVGEGIAAVMRLCPQFALGNGMLNISFMAIFSFLDDEDYTPLDLRITGSGLVYMAILSVVYFVLLLFVERWVEREGGGKGGGGGYLFVACLGRSTIDHACLSRRSTVSTRIRDTADI